MRVVLALMGLFLWVGAAFAHEVRPTIGDLTAGEDRVTLELQLNVEAFVAGIDLDGLEDTNVAPEAEAYDELRALDPEALEERFAAVADAMAARIGLLADSASVELSVSSIDIGPTGDVEALRDSRVTFTGDLPEAEALNFVWPPGYGTLILRQMVVPDGYTGYLDGGQSSGPIALDGGDAASGWQVFARYIPVGIDHIVPKGLDHILFVLGLFFLSTRLGPLLWQVTAFTLAHTVTLALGALGIVNIPGSIVEPIIAASIVYVAVENIISPKMNRWRPVLVFGFGLLHGLGFASVLGEFGLPAGQFIPALIGFNIGVELGQLAVIAAAAVLLWLGAAAARMSNLPPKEDMVGEYEVMHRAFSMTGSLVIAVIAVYWVIERTLL